MDLKAFEAELRSEHAALSAEYEAKHQLAEEKWGEYEAIKKRLVGFREKYGHVLKALDAGAVKVEG